MPTAPAAVCGWAPAGVSESCNAGRARCPPLWEERLLGEFPPQGRLVLLTVFWWLVSLLIPLGQILVGSLILSNP